MDDSTTQTQPQPTMEKTTTTEVAGDPKVTTTEKVSTTTDSAAVIALSPPKLPATAPAPDDDIRKNIAYMVILSEAGIIILGFCLLFFASNNLAKDTLTIIATLIGSVFGYKARDTGTVIGYLFGGSSGATSSRTALESKLQSKIPEVVKELPKEIEQAKEQS